MPSIRYAFPVVNCVWQRQLGQKKHQQRCCKLASLKAGEPFRCLLFIKLNWSLLILTRPNKILRLLARLHRICNGRGCCCQIVSIMSSFGRSNFNLKINGFGQSDHGLRHTPSVKLCNKLLATRSPLLQACMVLSCIVVAVRACFMFELTDCRRHRLLKLPRSPRSYYCCFEVFRRRILAQ